MGGGTWVVDPCEEEAREDGAEEDVDIAEVWRASVRTRVGLKESKRPSLVGGVGRVQRRPSGFSTNWRDGRLDLAAAIATPRIRMRPKAQRACQVSIVYGTGPWHACIAMQDLFLHVGMDVAAAFTALHHRPSRGRDSSRPRKWTLDTFRGRLCMPERTPASSERCPLRNNTSAIRATPAGRWPR